MMPDRPGPANAGLALLGALLIICWVETAYILWDTSRHVQWTNWGF